MIFLDIRPLTIAAYPLTSDSLERFPLRIHESHGEGHPCIRMHGQFKLPFAGRDINLCSNRLCSYARFPRDGKDDYGRSLGLGKFYGMNEKCEVVP